MKARALGTITKRELRAFFVSPVAYIVMTIYLALTGWFFFSTFFLAGRADMRSFFSMMPILFSFTIPAITMRLFSEEYSTGSFEMLKTQPLTMADIVGGKFLASLLFILIMIVPTLAYAVSVGTVGELDWGPVFGGYIGAVLLAGAYSAIGIFASSLTRNQIVAFIISAAICVMLSLINQLTWMLPPALGNLLASLGTGYHFTNISRGIIDSRDLVYFASVIFLALYGSWLLNQEKK
ncbi:MAG: ABC transporter permease subunit [Spirochaetales bacterium]|uniref:ABC transporter permease subunit n=1 Tax=Candidatus Thalassospirochaeta sargassi TaxID=3119039 RepID=A0AAJ1IDH3_9SPIO|nr:ABC transporter permease subunit [Spirochaetales bacterium]